VGWWRPKCARIYKETVARIAAVVVIWRTVGARIERRIAVTAFRGRETVAQIHPRCAPLYMRRRRRRVMLLLLHLLQLLLLLLLSTALLFLQLCSTLMFLHW
jgi:hypothetical protein